MFDFLWIIFIINCRCQSIYYIVLKICLRCITLSLCLSFFYCWWWSRLGQLLMTFFFVKSRHHFQSHGRLSFRLWKKKDIYSAFWLLWDFSALFIDFRSIWSWYLIWNLYHKNTMLHISIEHDFDTFFDFGIYHQFFLIFNG